MSLLEPVVGRLVGDNTDYVRSLHDADRRTGGFADDTDRHFGRMGTSIGKFAKVAAVGLGAAAVGVGLFLKKSVEAAEESRKVAAQTEAVIKSTGGAANVSAAQVGAYADKLAALTGIDDEAIASGQNLLLTFTRVRNEAGKGNDVFNQGTKAALNMSVALKQDLQSSSMLVGKALNDPIKGVTALTRSGIQFTEQQKAQIKAMTESGNVLGAQKIILKELETQFGGSAEAAASPMERLKVVVGNLQEELGARLLPVIGRVASFLADNLPGALDRVGQFVGPLVEKIGLFAGAFRSAFSGEGVTSDGFVGVMERIGVAARAVIDWIVANWPQVQATISAVVQGVVEFVDANWPRIQATIASVMETVVAVISGVVDLVMTIWNNFGEQIVSYTQSAFENAMTIIGGAMDVIQGIIATVTAVIHGDWSAAWDGIKQALGGAFDAIIGLAHQWDNIMRTVMSVAMEVLGSIVRSAFGGIVGFVASIPGRILGALGHLGSLLYDAGRAVIAGLLNGIRDAVQGVYNFVSGIAGKIRSLKGPIEKDRSLLVPAGRAIMDSLVVGLRDHEGRLVSQLAHVTGLISDVGGDVSVNGTVTGGGGSSAVAGSAITGTAGAGGQNMHVTVQIVTPTGVIPDSTMRQLRTQLFELGNDLPGGSIVPAA